jgi:hypothetical protein
MMVLLLLIGRTHFVSVLAAPRMNAPLQDQYNPQGRHPNLKMQMHPMQASDWLGSLISSIRLSREGMHSICCASAPIWWP